MERDEFSNISLMMASHLWGQEVADSEMLSMYDNGDWMRLCDKRVPTQISSASHMYKVTCRELIRPDSQQIGMSIHWLVEYRRGKRQRSGHQISEQPVVERES